MTPDKSHESFRRNREFEQTLIGTLLFDPVGCRGLDEVVNVLEETRTDVAHCFVEGYDRPILRTLKHEEFVGAEAVCDFLRSRRQEQQN